MFNKASTTIRKKLFFFSFSRSHSTKRYSNIKTQMIAGIPLKDYDYCKLIDENINHSNISNAYHTVLQSYFHNVVLDADVFGRLIFILLAHQWDLSYPVVLYKLFRQSFEPSLMLFPILKSLRNTDIRQLVDSDIQYLQQKINNQFSQKYRPGRRVKTNDQIEDNEITAQDSQNSFGILFKKIKIYHKQEIESTKSMTLNELFSRILVNPPQKVSIGEVIIKKKSPQ